MKVFCLWFIISLQIALPDLYGQQPKEFTLKVSYPEAGSSSLRIGEAIFLKNLCAATFYSDSSNAKDGQFTFTGELLYPTAVRVFSSDQSQKLNCLFFIDSGFQEIDIFYDSLNADFKVVSNSKINHEYERFVAAMHIIDINQDIPEDLFELYVEENPTSYVALFALFDQTFNYGFSPGLKRVSDKFHQSLKATKGYKAFINEQAINKKIPSVNVKSVELNDISLQFTRTDKMFTLIEFWYAGCMGCIPAMQELKKKYSALKEKVHFLSVNTDAQKDFDKSLKVLMEMELPWTNYWDFEEAGFGKIINLYVYPSNLLVNSEGIIIAKDIDITKIEEFVNDFSCR